MAGFDPWSAGASLVGTGLDFISSQQRMGQQQQQIEIARAQQAQALALQQEMMRRQYELSTASQTDARGNKLIYSPEKGWISLLSPEGQALLNRSDAIQRQFDVRNLGTGEEERNQGTVRRQAEASAASPLLEQMKQNYGGPTREGVYGATKVAGATAASENADAARSGFNAAALRTGVGAVPLQSTLASLDRSAVGGIRTALANADISNPGAYTAARSDFTGSKLTPYNLLATRASNAENIPFSPSDIPASMDTMSLNRAARAPGGLYGSGTGAGGQAATNALLAQMGLRANNPSYGSQFGAIASNFKGFGDWLFGNKDDVESPAAANARGFGRGGF